jgi:hypothetical protein
VLCKSGLIRARKIIITGLEAVSAQRLSLRGLYNRWLACGMRLTQFRHSVTPSPSPLPHFANCHTMGLAGVLSVFVVKRHEKPWEVVDSKSVEPVPLFDEEDGACAISYIIWPRASDSCVADIDIIYVHETRVVRTFVFDVRKDEDLENSLLFAQQQFLEQVERRGYNALWSEGCAQHVSLR